MAKQRKSIFDTDTNPDKIKKAASKVQEKTIDDIPEKNVGKKVKSTSNKTVKSVAKKSTGQNGKYKMIYIDPHHHRLAKSKSSLKGMTIGEYIADLIDNDD